MLYALIFHVWKGYITIIIYYNFVYYKSALLCFSSAHSAQTSGFWLNLSINPNICLKHLNICHVCIRPFYDGQFSLPLLTSGLVGWSRLRCAVDFIAVVTINVENMFVLSDLLSSSVLSRECRSTREVPGTC